MHTEHHSQGNQPKAKPATDNVYFERMSRVIFTAGLNWKMIENKWPEIRQAFAGFDIPQVANFLEPEIEELMMNPAVIHNLAKIRAIIGNAKEFQAIASEHRSFKNYLRELRKAGGEEGLLKNIAGRFHFMGQSTTMFFLFSAGEELPEAHKKWMNRHKTSTAKT